MTLALSPSAYAAMLRRIPVSLPDGRACSIAITHYRCEREDNGGARAGMVFKDAVVASARHLGVETYSAHTESDPAILSMNHQRRQQAHAQHQAFTPAQQTLRLDMRRAVTGKATIDQIRSVLTNLANWIAAGGPDDLGPIDWPMVDSYWGRHQGVRIKGPAFVDRLRSEDPLPSKLQMIADTFFGYDCNGFVGSWLRMNGMVNRNAETWIPGFFENADAIQSLDEIRPYTPYMLIRFKGNTHINIIEAAGSGPHDWIIFGSESGGIGQRPYTIHAAHNAPGRFRVVGTQNGMSSDSAQIGPAEGRRRRVPAAAP